MVEISRHFKEINPSSIRLAQIEHMKRTDDVDAVNVAIGNVSLPIHPALKKRMFNLDSNKSPFNKGVVKYSATVGFRECNRAFLNIIGSSSFNIDDLHSQIVDGGSQAMELVLLGTCRPDKKVLLIDAAYTNYLAMAKRIGVKTISITRELQDDGKFTLPKVDEIEKVIKKNKPAALVVIPYDNPTGQFYTKEIMKKLAKLCVKYDMWMISDEAYRELYYLGDEPTSIWGIDDSLVKGINGRRISIETSSKVWNACGLRIGAIITDNRVFNNKGVAEYTANLCPNVIGQYIFGALAHISHDKLNNWYRDMRKYYQRLMKDFFDEMKARMPKIIVSSPDASIYSVVDVRNLDKDFDAKDFVLFCAQEGTVDIDGIKYTLLVSPMEGFYSKNGLGKTQMRIAYVETPERMRLVPRLFEELLDMYLFKKYQKKELIYKK
jgi:aspartate aminotransferase